MVACRAARLTKAVRAGRPLHPHLAASSSASAKCFATSSTGHNSVSKTPRAFPTRRHEALTLIHKATKLLRSIYDLRGTSGSGRTKEVWDRILSKAHEDLSTTEERPVRLVVYSLDECSGAQDLLTALLADPLSSDHTLNEALYGRWNSVSHKQLIISYNIEVKTGPSSLQLPSGYLQQFSEIIEIRSARTSNPMEMVLESPVFLDSDIIIFVCNPLVTPLSDIPTSLLPSNSILVFNSNMPQPALDAILDRRISSSTSLHGRFEPARILSADPTLAVNAIKHLQNDPKLLPAIQQYQDNTMSSQISSVSHAIRAKLAANESYPARTRIAVARLIDALNASSSVIHDARHELDKAFIDASNLRERIEELRAKAAGEVFERREAGMSSKVGGSEVADAVKQAEKDMAEVMDRLTWWRMIWRVDEISSIVANAVSRTWCRGLEKKLVLHAGQLSTVQRDTSKLASELLSRHPIIRSALLQNALLQLKASPTYAMTPETLTKPIYSRRDQIIEYPTTRLHLVGQQAVIGMTGGVVSGVGIGWAGWLGWLLGSGEGLLAFAGMDASTAIGVGMLSAVASVRWGVGRWEKAKKRWWQDWARVGEGLDRDLKTTLDHVMRKQVIVVAETAADGVSDLVREREEKLAEVSKELEALQDGVKGVMGDGPKP